MIDYSEYDFEGKAHVNESGEVVLDFGKHQGPDKTIRDVPTTYLQWMLGEEFPEDLVVAVEEELERRD